MAVIDGDTFTMDPGRGTVTVRLADVGAPEKGQPGAEAAAQKLAQLLGQGRLKYKKRSESHNRWVCDIWNAEDVHVNAAMRQYLGQYFGR